MSQVMSNISVKVFFGTKKQIFVWWGLRTPAPPPPPPPSPAQRQNRITRIPWHTKEVWIMNWNAFLNNKFTRSRLMQKITRCSQSSEKDVKLISVRATSHNTDSTVKQYSYLKRNLLLDWHDALIYADLIKSSLKRDKFYRQDLIEVCPRWVNER